MPTTTEPERRASPSLRERLGSRPVLVTLIVGAVLVIAFVLWWFQPQALLFDTVVDEGFPVVDGDDSAAAADGEDAENASDDMTDDDADDLSDDDAGDMADDDAGDMADDDPDDMSDGEMDGDDTAPTEPVALSSGSFVSLNRYTVTGDATVFELPDGSRVLRLEDFESTNGPDLFVYLTAANSDASDSEMDDDAIDLGVLSGNIGNQNYDIPADVDLDRYDTVVIWCRRFTTSFGAADLAPA